MQKNGIYNYIIGDRKPKYSDQTKHKRANVEVEIALGVKQSKFESQQITITPQMHKQYTTQLEKKIQGKRQEMYVIKQKSLTPS